MSVCVCVCVLQLAGGEHAALLLACAGVDCAAAGRRSRADEGHRALHHSEELRTLAVAAGERAAAHTMGQIQITYSLAFP